MLPPRIPHPRRCHRPRIPHPCHRLRIPHPRHRRRSTANLEATSANRLAISPPSTAHNRYCGSRFVHHSRCAGGVSLALPAVQISLPMVCPRHRGLSYRSGAHHLSIILLSSACVCTLLPLLPFCSSVMQTEWFK
ncbi:hypothetical protein VPH35_065842 [Triticum aestivum]